jgi:hypothetical protein
MLLGLLPLGLSFNSTRESCVSTYDSLIPGSVLLLPVISGGLGSGLAVLEIVQVCESAVKTNSTISEVPEIVEVKEPSARVLLVPVVFSIIAYLGVILVIQASKYTRIELDGQETVPEQTLCLEALELPAIELFPPRVMELPIVKSSDLWKRAFDGAVEVRKSCEMGCKARFSPPPGGDLEFFDPVPIHDQYLSKRCRSSLFSNENWY